MFKDKRQNSCKDGNNIFVYKEKKQYYCLCIVLVHIWSSLALSFHVYTLTFLLHIWLFGVLLGHAIALHTKSQRWEGVCL